MKQRTRDYITGYLAGKHIIQYDEGGRTWFERDNAGRVRYFDTEGEATAAIKHLRPRQRERSNA